MDINITFLKNEIKHNVKLNLKLLDGFRTDTDSILFIDLIKRMIREKPDERETREKLFDHAVFMDDKKRFEIVDTIFKKCFHWGGDNKYLIQVVDKNELHLEGFLGEESEPWKECLVELSMYKPEGEPELKICSSLLLNKEDSYHIVILIIYTDSEY